MHICPDEVIPFMHALGHVPHIARVLWYKVTWWFL